MCTLNHFKIFLAVLSLGFLQTGCRIANTIESATDGSTTPSTEQQLKISANKSTINLTEGTNAILLVVSDKPASKKVTFNWQITTGASGDFTTTSGTTFILAGENSFSITINTINDSTYEVNKNYTLSVWSDDTRVTNNLDIGIVLADDDPQYTISFASSTQTITEASGSVNIPVNLTAAYGSDFTINYSIAGTATENTDYSITGSGSVVLTNGNTSVNIPLSVTDDSLIEGAETIILTLTTVSDSNIELGATTALTITLNDNDIAVKPNAGYLIPNETLSLTVTGGDGSFTYAMVGSPASTIHPTTGVITAAAAAETFTIRVSDGSGNTKDVNYEVIDPKADVNLGLWLKAGELGLTDGDPVGTWPDLTANGHNFSQGTSSYRPTYVASGLNSRPVVRFDGTDDEMDSSYMPPTGASARTVTFVISGLYIKGNSSVFSWGNNSLYGQGYGFTVFGPNTSSRHSGTFYIDQHLNNSYLTAAYAPLITESYIISIEYTGTVSRYYINGVANSATTESLGTGTVKNMMLGDHVANNRFYKGDLAELLLHEGTVASGDRQKIECYLSRLYNIPVNNGLNCGVETLKWNYRGSISLQTSTTMTPLALGGVPPYTYSVVSGTSTIDANTGLLTASATEETATLRVTDNVGQTADLDVDIVSIPIPISWLNLSKGASGYSDGDPTRYIRDISGNENEYFDLNNSTSPIYRTNSINSLPSLEFDGSKFLSAAFRAPTSSASRTFFVVVKNTVSGNFFSYGSDSNCAGEFRFDASATFTRFLNACNTYTSTGATTTAAKLLAITYDGSTLRIYEDGVQVYSSSSPAISTRTDFGVKLGSGFKGTNEFLTGNIGEFLVYNSVLSAGDRALVETYLATKFGL